MDDLESEFFQEDQDDIFVAALSGCYSESELSLNCSLSETPNKCSDNLKNSCVEVLQEKNLCDNRFSFRFTPKAVKRKFAGPAGLILDEDSEDLLDCNAEPVPKKLLADADYQSISSSQSSVEELFLSSSWRKLQEEVSSNLRFLSVVKCFSIRRVLSDTSKKKLPKHIIVPALCVYIKEFKPDDPVFVCLDDTGEINGKIDKEVLQEYSNFIKCGTSLVLKQVTFLCNVLLLQKASVLSFYLDDGSVQHVQDWNTIIDKESLNSLNCTYPITPKLTEKQKHFTDTVKKTPIANSRLEKPKLQNKLIHSENVPPASNAVLPKNILKNQMRKLITNSPTSSINQDFEANMMDDFDELLGNIDEKSFMEEF